MTGQDRSTSGQPGASLDGKRIVLGVTGGIAAYKAAELCRLFVKAGATVRVVMTDAATRFIAPLTLQTLSGAPVARDIFDAENESSGSEIGHIRLADEANLLVVAPATADAIARLAAGMANDLLTAVALATRARILLAPAMNVNMWRHPLTQANLERLLRLPAPDDAPAVGAAAARPVGARVSTVGPDRGPLACGWIGEGRLIEPAEIVAAAAELLGGVVSPGAAVPGSGTGDRSDLAGRRVVVTAGPTREPIDDVRFLGNRSSGKMGAALAAAALARGARVTLIAGPGTPAVAALERIDIETAAELEQALDAALRDPTGPADVVVMAAAVADFRPLARVPGKLSRRQAGAEVALALEPVPDLLAGLAEARAKGRIGAPMLVGFAAEIGAGAGDAAVAARAQAKLREKRCDAIVANDVSAPGIGFDADDNEVTAYFADDTVVRIGRAPKRAVAERLWDLLAPRLAPRATRKASHA